MMLRSDDHYVENGEDTVANGHHDSDDGGGDGAEEEDHEDDYDKCKQHEHAVHYC